MAAAIEKREAEQGPDPPPHENWLTKAPPRKGMFPIKEPGWTEEDREDLDY